MNTKITAKQRRFIEEYLLDLNASAAYRRAGYIAQGVSADVNAARLLGNAKVAAEIKIAMENRAARVGVESDMVLRRLWDIATADPRELVQVVVHPCAQCWSADDQRGAPNADCRHCHGHGVRHVVVSDTRNLSGSARALYAGAKLTKYGVEVKFHDQLAAMDKIARHLGMFNDKVTLAGDAENPLQILIRQIQGSALKIQAG